MKYNHKNYPEIQTLVIENEHYLNCQEEFLKLHLQNKGEIEKINNLIKENMIINKHENNTLL